MSSKRRAMGMVVALALVFSACSGGGGGGGGPSSKKTTTGGTLVYGADGDLKGFNPGTSKTGGLLTTNVAENIFFYAAKATPQFTLDFVGLDRPPAVVSTNPQVVEWVINKDARWGDKSPVTSEDLRYYLEQVTNKANDVDVGAGYDQITKFEVTGEKSVRATFASPFADYATLFEAVPQAAFLKAQPGGWNTGLDASPGPSAGPYMVGTWNKGESLTLVRNPEWWGAKKPGLDSIVFRFFAAGPPSVDALANNEIDMMTPSSADPDVLSRARATPGVDVVDGPSANWEVLTFNTRNSPLADPLVRRAVALAIDRNAIVNAVVKPVSAAAKPLGNFIYMPNQPTYQAHDGAYVRADPAGARKLLAQAGWAQAGDGWTKDAAPLKLTLSTTTDAPRVAQMDLVASELKTVGIATTRDDCALACLRQRMTGAGPFDVTGFGWTGGLAAVSSVRSIYQTGSSKNFGGWSSPRFDDLMKSAVVETTPERQAEIANQADQVLWDELPGLPLYQKPNVLIVRSRFSGPVVNGGGDGVFWNSQDWTVKPGK